MRREGEKRSRSQYRHGVSFDGKSLFVSTVLQVKELRGQNAKYETQMFH